MDSDSVRLTRREVVKRGVTASILVAVGLDAKVATAASSAGSSGSDVLPGVLARVLDQQTALVDVAGRGATRVTLAPDAFVSHGVEGKVADLSRFLPGERVAVRGSGSNGALTAVEFQSIYTEESGVVAVDAAGRPSVRTSRGVVPSTPDVTVRSGSNPHARAQPGAQASATIWTNPATGEQTAIMLCSNA
jgi:hypothetical protein